MMTLCKRLIFLISHSGAGRRMLESVSGLGDQDESDSSEDVEERESGIDANV
jgi:hypothetical protein